MWAAILLILVKSKAFSLIEFSTQLRDFYSLKCNIVRLAEYNYIFHKRKQILEEKKDFFQFGELLANQNSYH